MYQLKQPKKNSQPVGYWIFVTALSGLMLYMVLINPLLTWPFDRPGEVSRLEYGLLTGGAILTALLAMIPVVRNDRSHNYALAMLWANREYIEHEEYMTIIDYLNPNMIKDNGSKKVLAELQKAVDSHKGKHITGHKYFKKEYIKDLELARG